MDDNTKKWWWFDPRNKQHIHEFSASWEILRRTGAYRLIYDRMRVVSRTIDKNSPVRILQIGAAMISFRNLFPQSSPEAKKKPIPPAALTWTDNPDVRLLAAICRELQIIHGNEPFYLSGRMVQRIFKHDTHATGAKWLRSFCVMQILDEVKKGKGVMASRYRFNFSSV